MSRFITVGDSSQILELQAAAQPRNRHSVTRASKRGELTSPPDELHS